MASIRSGSRPRSRKTLDVNGGVGVAPQKQWRVRIIDRRQSGGALEADQLIEVQSGPSPDVPG